MNLTENIQMFEFFDVFSFPALCSVKKENWAENFRMVDIENTVWGSPFLNLETNVILQLYP